MPIQAVKGTHDLFGKEAECYRYIENVFDSVCHLYGYTRFDTPILEHTEVFDRATGEGSDVVRKEMYTFLDKGNRSVTLRPEMTAGVARSIVENKLYATWDSPMKLYYHGPVFRYERPQLGRYRQFFQAGVECVGTDSARLDAECIALAMKILSFLGFTNLKVIVNTLGDKESRLAYRDALREYFASRIDSMCNDCKQRLLLNPMRILDCKVPEDQEIAKGAPKMKEYLSESAEKRFYETLSILADAGIDYEIDDSLVRGLDYYGHIVFEVHAVSNEGKDYGALLGGGHYDGMLANFGGPEDKDHGVGFAMGVERIYSLMNDNGLLNEISPEVDVYMMPIGDSVVQDAFLLAETLRNDGFSVEMPSSSGKLGSMFKKADRKGATFAIILGEEELDKGVVQIKNLKTQHQETVSIGDISGFLDQAFDVIDDEKYAHHHHEEE